MNPNQRTRQPSWSRLPGYLLFPGIALSFAACVSDVEPETVAPAPDAGVMVATDVSSAAPDASGAASMTPTANAELGAYVVFEFEGEFNRALGTFDVRMVETEDANGELRTQNQGLYCDATVVVDGFVGSNPRNTVEVISEGGVLLGNDCGAGTGALTYEDASGAICGDITIRSFYEVPLQDVYAEVVFMQPLTGNRAYTWTDRQLFGLGNGAQRPANGQMSDQFGLFFYDDIGAFASRPLNEQTVRWIFKDEGTGTFYFRGRVVSAIQELCNGRDDDCDSRVDEGNSCLGPLVACQNNIDCDTGLCRDGLCRSATCNNGVQDPNETQIDCGGECGGCPNGSPCVTNAQCLERTCVGGVCVPGTDTDADGIYDTEDNCVSVANLV